MTNVFEVLRKDHEEVRAALTELETGPTSATGAGEDQLKVRERMVEQLIIEESKHEAVEEEYFWPTVRERVPDGDRLADRAVEQEQKAKFVLNDLMGVTAEQPRFEELLATFMREDRRHMAFEEQGVWPLLEKTLSTEEADELGTKIQEGKKIAPTRPHPHTPPKPGILKATGPAVAAADKARDAATGRDRD